MWSVEQAGPRLQLSSYVNYCQHKGFFSHPVITRHNQFSGLSSLDCFQHTSVFLCHIYFFFFSTCVYHSIMKFTVTVTVVRWSCILFINTRPRSTWLTVLRQPQTSPVDSDYALPVVTNFLCRVTNSVHLVVGPSLSLDRWLVIRCQLTSVIRRSLKTFLFAKY